MIAPRLLYQLLRHVKKTQPGIAAIKKFLFEQYLEPWITPEPIQFENKNFIGKCRHQVQTDLMDANFGWRALLPKIALLLAQNIQQSRANPLGKIAGQTERLCFIGCQISRQPILRQGGFNTGYFLIKIGTTI